MAELPPLPPGFKLDTAAVPPPPAGFTLDQPKEQSRMDVMRDEANASVARIRALTARMPSDETMAGMRNNPVALGIDAAISDPVGTAAAIPSGFNQGVAMLAGLPMDTATSFTDLLGMAYGAGRAAASGRPAGEFYEPYDRSQIVGTGEWNARMLDRGTTAIGAGPVTQNLRPENPAARVLYSAASAVPGALTGRQALSAGAGGATGGIIAEAGGGAGAQAIGGILGDRTVDAVPTRTQRPQRGSFGPDSASAAAAVPDLARVPQEIRPQLVAAFRRGERDLVQRVIEAETLPIPVNLMEGQARGDATLISREQNMRAADPRIAERMQAQNRALIDNLDEIRRNTAPNVVAADHVQNGQALIDSYKQYDAPIKANIDQLYKNLRDAAGGNFPVNGKAFVKAADAALAKQLKSDFVPPEIERVMNRLRDGGNMTFEQFEALRTNLAAAARKADRAGDGNAAAAVGTVREALESLPMEAVPIQLKALADKARNAARIRFEALKKDPAYRAAVDDETPVGELSPFADDFVKRYVINGKAANIQLMQQTLKNDQIARETIAAAALNYVKSKSGINLYTNEGNFSQAGYNRALSEIMPRISVLMPAEAAELAQQLGRVAHSVQVQPRGSSVNNSNTFVAAAGEAAKAYGEGTANALVPGANLGTFVRDRRARTRQRQEADRALNAQSYLEGERR